MVGGGVVHWKVGIEGCWGGLVLLSGPGWGGRKGGWFRPRGEAGWKSWRWCVLSLLVACAAVGVGGRGGGVVGHGLGGPHACEEDHQVVPGVARSGACAGLGGWAGFRQGPDELQLDRGGGNCSCSAFAGSPTSHHLEDLPPPTIWRISHRLPHNSLPSWPGPCW